MALEMSIEVAQNTSSLVEAIAKRVQPILGSGHSGDESLNLFTGGALQRFAESPDHTLERFLIHLPETSAHPIERLGHWRHYPSKAFTEALVNRLGKRERQVRVEFLKFA